MTAAFDLFPPLPLPEAASTEPIEVRHGRLIRAFGAAEGTLLLVLEEEYRKREATPQDWLHISRARWIQQAARLSGGMLPFPRNRLRHHLSLLARSGVTERRYVRRSDLFEFRLNREVLEHRLSQARKHKEEQA